MFSSQPSALDLSVDRNGLYREESYSDLKAASIRKMVPVTEKGLPDESRPALFVGTIQVMTPGGALPIQSQLSATTLEDAVREFPKAMEKALAELLDEIKRMEQEASSRIVVPDMRPGAPVGGKMPGGRGGGLIY